MPIGPHALPSMQLHCPPPHNLSPPHLMACVDFERARDPNVTRPKWATFHWAPEAMWWMESSGLPLILPSVQKLCEENNLLLAHYLQKQLLITLLCEKWLLFTHTCQIYFSFINPKKPQIIVFIIFLTIQFHAHVYKHPSCQPTYNCTLKTLESSQIAFHPTWSFFPYSQLPVTWFRPNFLQILGI